MRTLLDFLPIALFFGTYKLVDVYAASAVLMAATLAQVGIIYAIDRKIPLMHKVTLGMVLVFGTLTLALHDDNFIKWKPTVLYAAFSLAMAVGLWGMKKNFVQMLMSTQLHLPDAVWYRLSIIWIAYNAFMSALNAYVVLNYSTDDWFNFKLWGYIFPLAFIIGQGIYIAPHLSSNERKDAESEA